MKYEKYRDIFFIILILFAIVILITSIIQDLETQREQKELIKSGKLCIGCEADETIMDLGSPINTIINLSDG